MSRYSNVTNWSSSDGLPSNPYPAKAIKTYCAECSNEVETEICPHCGHENKIDYEPDYEAGNTED
jgi:hypothetical protein